MSKFAAVIAALAAASPATIAAIAGTVATGVGLVAQQRAQREQRMQQEEANREWEAYQQEAQARYLAAEEEQRPKATEEVLDFAKSGDIDTRMADLATRADELETRLAPAATPVSDVLFQGQQTDDKDLNAHLGKKLAEATSEARTRMQALARAGSYGGHMTGMNREAADVGARVANINDVRVGSLNALNRAQTITPEQIGYNSTGLAEGLMAIGPQVAGWGFGQMGGFGNAGKLDVNGMPKTPITGVTRPLPRPANFNPALPLG